MRIGTNHGSLSDRIMSYYGDSPRGMVSSYFSTCSVHTCSGDLYTFNYQ